MDYNKLPFVTSPEIYEHSRDKKKHPTFHPEGLFSEQIFGPVRDYTCRCGITKIPEIEPKSIQEAERCSICHVPYVKSSFRSTQHAKIPLPFTIPSVHIVYLLLRSSKQFKEAFTEFRDHAVDLMYQLIDEYKDSDCDSLSSELRKTLCKLIKTKPELLEKDFILVIPPDLRPISGSKNNYTTDTINHFYLKLLEQIDAFSKELEAGFVNENYHKNVIISSYLELYDHISSIGVKEGDIRQRILAKRVDFSARTVDTVDHTLNMDQIKVSYKVLVKIYEPYILYHYKGTHLQAFNDIELFNRKQIITPEIKEAIDETAKYVPVLINRQPTLHRGSIRAYWVLPTDDDIIAVNPYISDGFNLDFDGDTQAIHAPLLKEELEEYKTKFINSKNQLVPGSLQFGSIGQYSYSSYIMTRDEPNEQDVLVETTWENLTKKKIKVLLEEFDFSKTIKVDGIYTTLGRTLFAVYFQDKTLLTKVVDKKVFDAAATLYYYKIFMKKGYITYKDVAFLDELLREYLVKVPINISIRDFTDLFQDKEYKELKKSFNKATGSQTELLKEKIEQKLHNFVDYGNIGLFIKSRAKGQYSNVLQILGYKGVVTSVTKKAIPYLIRHSLLEGLTPQEFLVMSFSTRKGSMDRSVNTAITGYLSRRLAFALIEVELDQNTEDCGTTEALEVEITKDNVQAYIFRYVVNEDGSLTQITPNNISEFVGKKVKLRSPMFCKNEEGICKTCYPYDTFFSSKYVGAIAAQALGERNTQLTMRTFHTGGVAKDLKDHIDFMNFDIRENLVYTKIDITNITEIDTLEETIEPGQQLAHNVYILCDQGEIILPKGLILRENLHEVNNIPADSLIAEIPGGTINSLTSIMDEIIAVLDYAEKYEWSDIYKQLMDAFFYTEGIISIHFEVLLTNMMRDPLDIYKQYRFVEDKKSIQPQIVSIKKLPKLRPLLSLGFQEFQKSLLSYMLQNKSTVLKPTLFERILSGYPKPSEKGN